MGFWAYWSPCLTPGCCISEAQPAQFMWMQTPVYYISISPYLLSHCVLMFQLCQHLEPAWACRITAACQSRAATEMVETEFALCVQILLLGNLDHANRLETSFKPALPRPIWLWLRQPRTLSTLIGRMREMFLALIEQWPMVLTIFRCFHKINPVAEVYKGWHTHTHAHCVASQSKPFRFVMSHAMSLKSLEDTRS